MRGLPIYSKLCGCTVEYVHAENGSLWCFSGSMVKLMKSWSHEQYISFSSVGTNILFEFWMVNTVVIISQK